MSKTWQRADGTNWASDTMVEMFGNAGRYNVISGCAASYSGANLNVTIASGTVTHNGTSTSVAGNSVTLVADGSNPRWTWIGIDSTGTAVIVSGTAASAPVEPESGDIVEVALVYVTAGATVASSLTAYDQRVFAPTVSADTSVTSLSADDDIVTTTTLADVSGLSVAVAASTDYAFEMLIHYVSAAAADYKFGLTIPASATLHAMCIYTNTSGAGAISSITSSGGSISANGFGASTPGVIKVFGSLLVAGTAGNLQVQHAQVSASGTSYTKAKSRIQLY